MWLFKRDFFQRSQLKPSHKMHARDCHDQINRIYLSLVVSPLVEFIQTVIVAILDGKCGVVVDSAEFRHTVKLEREYFNSIRCSIQKPQCRSYQGLHYSHRRRHGGTLWLGIALAGAFHWHRISLSKSDLSKPFFFTPVVVFMYIKGYNSQKEQRKRTEGMVTVWVLGLATRWLLTSDLKVTRSANRG